MGYLIGDHKTKSGNKKSRFFIIEPDWMFTITAHQKGHQGLSMLNMIKCRELCVPHIKTEKDAFDLWVLSIYLKATESIIIQKEIRQVGWAFHKKKALCSM